MISPPSLMVMNLLVTFQELLGTFLPNGLCLRVLLEV
ncbi:hypothetical protein BMS3Abin09_00777 [bacterium BMS3Abin09]|nr:hypothetical protein BMS3Abin09_00777 [bacterium BMS3Abin09]GBE41406.1 hypothetical protein BMS3Bbin09_01309 [bacterium BMS3Bbin09]